MSEQSRSVANDLLRLEMQLAMVGSSGVPGLEGGTGNGSVGGITRSTRSLTSRSTPPVTGSSVPASTSAGSARRIATARRSRITIQAPPGRLGIILANKADSRGTVVSGVRSNSALSDRISPGDRIVAIDGEDVSLMTVSEITTIMARKADFERTLTVLTTPRHTEPTTTSTNGINSPRSSGGGVQQHRTSYRG
jgi:PDZ domain